MEYRSLGTSGLQVSIVGLGCNNFGGRMDVSQVRPVVDAAIDVGITFLDTADIYGNLQGNIGGSEIVLGEVLNGRRDQVVLATKFGYMNRDMGYGAVAGAKGGRAYIRRAVEASLRRLRTDYIDLYQLHAPDPVTPMVETLSALHELVLEGKVRYIGHSNLNGWQLAEADHVARENGLPRFISAQNRWSLLDREWEALVYPAAEHYGVGMIPYMPLAQGLLTGKVRRGEPLPSGTKIADSPQSVTEQRVDQVERLIQWGADHGRSLIEIAYGGLIGRPVVGTVIAGASRPEQVRSNVEAASWRPTAEELAAIDEIVPPPAPPTY
ncbi:MAG: aldo/keto reductase [Acidimicrobiaceae bacterium]|nr:aldo/keto reductase [Acidimicrobiaceae bacterium]